MQKVLRSPRRCWWEHTIIPDGHKPLAAAENILEAFALYADVAVHLYQLRSGQGQLGGDVVVPYLPKSGFIARRDAGQHSPLHSGNSHAGKPCFRQSKRERDVHRLTRLAVCPQHRTAFRFAVDRGRKHKVIGVQVGTPTLEVGVFLLEEVKSPLYTPEAFASAMVLFAPS